MAKKREYRPLVKLSPPQTLRNLPRREIKDPSQISNKKIEAFLFTYEKTMDFSDACRISGIPVRTMKGLIAQQPEIIDRMDEIEQARLDSLEQLVFYDATTEPDARRWVLSRLRRGKWGAGGGGNGMTVNTNIQINNTTTPRELSEEELLRIATGGKTPIGAEVKEG